MIILWHGSIATIPTGWALCNGSNGTPDLRNRFIVCANADDSGTAKTTIAGPAQQTGGHAVHKHTVSADSHVHSFEYGDPTEDGEVWTSVDFTFGETGGHAPFDTDDSEDDDALPPFYALAYIMKT